MLGADEVSTITYRIVRPRLWLYSPESLKRGIREMDPLAIHWSSRVEGPMRKDRVAA